MDGIEDLQVLEDAGISREQAEDMYRYLALANYEDRFVVPSGHRELNVPEAYEERNACGFSFGNGCSGGSTGINLLRQPQTTRQVARSVRRWEEEA